VGNVLEKIDMMKALLESKEHIFNQKKAESEHIAVAMARIMGNVRARQNRLRDKGLKLIEERIEERDLDKNKILIVNVSDILEQSLTGLVANQLVSKYKRPCLLVRYHEEDVYGGSGRGYDKHEIKDFRNFLIDTNKFIFCEGHENAFGINIHKDNLVEVNDILNEKLSHVLNENVYEVDFVIPSNQINESIVKDIAQLRDVWGNTVGEPLLLIKDIQVNTSDIDNGQKKNVLKFTSRGIEFIRFKSSEEEYTELSKGENVTMDIVVKCGINEYNGVVKPQLVIEDYNVVKVGKKEYVF
jgi:single-stranded-DNA-specific exonuclease